VYMREWGDGEGVGSVSEASSLLSHTLRYVSLAELGNVCQVGSREPMHLFTCVSEEGVDGEGADSDISAVTRLNNFFSFFSFCKFPCLRPVSVFTGPRWLQARCSELGVSSCVSVRPC
jgi:hypothetical protein